jgi:hypothetical protein
MVKLMGWHLEKERHLDLHWVILMVKRMEKEKPKERH